MAQQEHLPEQHIYAALSYVWILCLVPLLLKRGDSYILFHAKQGLVLFVIEVVGAVIFWVPVIGWLLWVLVVLLAIIGFLGALQGKKIRLPVISIIADKITL
ncbi:MAG: hypothetical protein HYZ08_01820 [Candidatus Kerfeldbacteria bacterium]|nr:hypothetical protein [Candidatus Kerfeldbacteria bacterium]